MKHFFRFFISILVIGLVSSAADKVENRCGWYSNPTPQNTWLEDRDGRWIISVQGGYQAQGDWPEFDIDNEEMFVRTNSGSYGFGCACLKVTLDKAKKTVKKIHSSQTKKLSVCRADKKLKSKEPENPLEHQ